MVRESLWLPGGRILSGPFTLMNGWHFQHLRAQQPVFLDLVLVRIGVDQQLVQCLTVFMRGRLRHPFRFYANEDGTICAIICEITLRMEGLYSLVSSILDWAERNGSNEIVILDGVASTEHDDKAYCAAEEDLVRTMADKDISLIPQGFITGIPGGILNECLVRKIQGLTLLAKANKIEPDSGAAATLIDALNRFYEMEIDTTNLQEEKERIHSEFSELSQKYVEHREEISGMYM